ncbi:MAG: methyltransferase domain-containing protein, partial [Planctomycetota bacterium]
LALAELERVNRSLGGYRTSLSGIRRLLPADCRKFSLLDVGTGGADFPRYLCRWAEKRGIEVHIRGIDLSPIAVEYAREKCSPLTHVSIQQRDLFDVSEDEPYDIVHSSHVLHHFNGAQASQALAKMHALSRWGVVLNDGHRHPVAYYSFQLLARLFSRSRLIKNDGPISILRSFQRREIEAMAAERQLPPPRIRWHWAFRWEAVIPSR